MFTTIVLMVRSIRTDGRTRLDRLSRIYILYGVGGIYTLYGVGNEYIYFMGSETSPALHFMGSETIPWLVIMIKNMILYGVGNSSSPLYRVGNASFALWGRKRFFIYFMGSEKLSSVYGLGNASFYVLHTFRRI